MVGCVLSFLRVRVELLLMSQYPISHIFTPSTLLVFPLSANLVWRCTGDFLFALQYDVHNIVARIKISEPSEKWVPNECCWGRPRGPRVEQLEASISKGGDSTDAVS